ncbi:Annexin [Gryllus bimaculatus]|nr:Annexin [Gryllus bimaculatus]
MGDYYTPEPTVFPASGFNAAEDGMALRTAMKGFGTDEQTIIDILTHRSNSQRQEIAKFFTEEYGRNLIDDLKSELGGHFEDVIVALMVPHVDYLCKQLNKAMGVRNDLSVDRDRAREAAEQLYAAGELKFGTDEEVFNKIMAHESFPQLKLIFEAYKEISGRTIEQALQNELSGELLDAMLAIVENVQHPPTFFAKRIHDACEGMGTDDKTLIRIIVSRSEIDLGNIKREFERLYDKTLESVVKKERQKKDSNDSPNSAYTKRKHQNGAKCRVQRDVRPSRAVAFLPRLRFHRRVKAGCRRGAARRFHPWPRDRAGKCLRAGEGSHRAQPVLGSRSENPVGRSGWWVGPAQFRPEEEFSGTSRAILPVPTVRPVSPFNPSEDAATLRSAMKGLGTDEQTIIDIITQRTNSQRQEIAKHFSQEYERDIIEDLKSELGGHFEDVILALMVPKADYLCKELNKAMVGAGTDENTLIEILCSKTNKEIKDMVEAYERCITGNLKGVRNDYSVDAGRAKEAAEELHAAGELKIGTDEEVFNRILAHESFPQLKLIFEAYKEISGRTIEQALQDEISGDLLEAMLTIVENVQHPPTFFAKRLHDAVAGAGTEDKTLIRIIVCRSEIDLESIKREYEKLYDKTLESVVTNETSGDYKRALLALIGGP